jgi:hypothetical protein
MSNQSEMHRLIDIAYDAWGTDQGYAAFAMASKIMDSREFCAAAHRGLDPEHWQKFYDMHEGKAPRVGEVQEHVVGYTEPGPAMMDYIGSKPGAGLLEAMNAMPKPILASGRPRKPGPHAGEPLVLPKAKPAARRPGRFDGFFQAVLVVAGTIALAIVLVFAAAVVLPAIIK